MSKAKKEIPEGMVSEDMRRQLERVGFIECQQRAGYWHHSKLAFSWPAGNALRLMSDKWFRHFQCREGKIAPNGCGGRLH